MKKLLVLFILLISQLAYSGYVVDAGSTDVSFAIPFRLTTTSKLATGKTTTNFSYSYKRGSGSAATSLQACTDGTEGTHSDNTIKECANMAGVYELDLPDAVFAAGADTVTIYVEYDNEVSVFTEVFEVEIRVPTATLVTSVWDKDISAFTGAGEAGTYLKNLYDDGVTNSLWDTATSGNVADAVWNAAVASYGTTGTYGLELETIFLDGVTNNEWDRVDKVGTLLRRP